MFVSFAMISATQAFEGLSIGLVHNETDFSVAGTETTKGAIASGALDNNNISKAGSTDFGSLFVEWTFAQGSTIGLEHIPGDAEISKASRTQTNTEDLGQDVSGTITVSATVSDHTVVYAEPTLMFNDRFGIYAKGGFAQVTLTPKVTESADTIQSTYTAKDVYGVATGFGAKLYIGESFFAKAEYLETDYGKYAHTSTTGTLGTVTADIDTEQTRFAIGYNF